MKNKINLPGFTAQDSLDRTGRYYCAAERHDLRVSAEAVIPQFEACGACIGAIKLCCTFDYCVPTTPICVPNKCHLVFCNPFSDLIGGIIKIFS